MQRPILNLPGALVILCVLGLTACSDRSQEPLESEQITEAPSAEPQWSADELEAMKAVEQFLVVAGNYDLESMQQMISEKANIGISRFSEGTWNNRVITIQEYVENAQNSSLRPYYEPVKEWEILMNEGQLAFVYADAVLHSYGVPRTRNRDYFTLLKDSGEWKFLNLSFTSQPLPENEKVFDLELFARSYAQAWSGVRPEFVALFFAEDGSLQVNDGAPARGRDEIANVARSFMTDLPDMVVRFDSLVTNAESPEFHWTLIATNTGPGGTGNKVEVSGYEVWEMGPDGRIKKSEGHFPSEEYNRQLGIAN